MSNTPPNDTPNLANRTVGLLARALPSLLAAGGQAGAAAVTGAAQALWEVLGEPLKKQAAATLQKLASNPEDDKRLIALEAAIEDLLDEQAELRQRVAAILAAHADEAPNQSISNTNSNRNININTSGNISGSIFNTGDGNTFKA